MRDQGVYRSGGRLDNRDRLASHECSDATPGM